jgi:hypothetical protein
VSGIRGIMLRVVAIGLASYFQIGMLQTDILDLKLLEHTMGYCRNRDEM